MTRRAPEVSAVAYAVYRSSNKKLGLASTTYAAQVSCPASCVFRGAGCYAEEGMVAMLATRPLNALAARSGGVTPARVALAEAAAIRGLVADGRPLRLHTVGDCSTDLAARMVAAAAADFRRRGGGPVWTYTHAWETVGRSSWGGISVLASCETPEQVEAAHARGYASALVVEELPVRRRFAVGSASVIPCPAQTTAGVTCASCRLCFDDGRLRGSGLSIGFGLHGDGNTMRRARQALAGDVAGARRSSRDFVNEFRAAHGRWPTIREIERGARVSSSSAFDMRKRMRAEEAVGRTL